jgi:hypothetical protein
MRTAMRDFGITVLAFAEKASAVEKLGLSK